MMIMEEIEINNVESIIHLDNMKIPKTNNTEQEMKNAMNEVLQNKSVYNALKRLANE